MVDLYNAGKSRIEIISEYELIPSAFDTWLKQANKKGSFKEKDNLLLNNKNWPRCENETNN